MRDIRMITVLRAVVLPVAALVTAALVFGQAPDSRVLGPSGKPFRPGSLPSELRFSMQAHGDRLLRSGKERMIVTGTLATRSGTGQFRLVQDTAGVMRLDIQGAAGNRAIGVDRGGPWGAGGSAQREDLSIAETLLYNTPERFFLKLAEGMPVRKLGANFRMDGQIGTPYSGPTYDIYLAPDDVLAATGVKQQPKYYLVNSNTLLLERIQYRDTADGDVSVQTVLSDWQNVDGNRVPGTIVRLENGVEVLRVTATSVVYGPAAVDSAFARN